MPFKIVRNDITKVKADVIVNTANPNPICASGTDLAIYEAAGKEQLLAERTGIGKIARGDIAVTGAYNLKAKYIIHTVGPVWTDGKHQEFEILESCYRKSLQKALNLQCTSIAFPLISTGVYGFPKDKALQIAITVFSQFLLENEMEIILVVFDKRSFQLSGQIVGDIDSYIDTNYVRESHRKEYPIRSRRSTRIKELAEEDFNEEMLQREEDNYPFEEMTDTGMTELLMSLENISLEDQLANIGVSFHDKLFELIDEAHPYYQDVLCQSAQIIYHERKLQYWPTGLPMKYFENMNKEAFIKQATEFKQSFSGFTDKAIKTLTIAGSSHPWTVLRAAELLTWYESGEYQDILNANTSSECSACHMQIPAGVKRCPYCGNEV